MSTQSVTFRQEAAFTNPIPDDKLNRAGVQLAYKHPNGLLYQGDSITWLGLLKAQSVNLLFADPPYNLNKAEWDTFESQEKYIEWSLP